MEIGDELMRMAVFTGLALLAATAHGANELRAGIEACRDVSDDAARLACYDKLAGHDDASRPGIRDTATPAPLDDSVGKPAEASDEPPRVYLARLVRCSDGTSTRQRYHLDNGQIWEQRNSGVRHVRNCTADVEIQTVSFGFKMAIPSKRRVMRVVRIQ